MSRERAKLEKRARHMLVQASLKGWGATTWGHRHMAQAGEQGMHTENQRQRRAAGYMNQTQTGKGGVDEGASGCAQQ